jgi:hypothetical protein
LSDIRVEPQQQTRMLGFHLETTDDLIFQPSAFFLEPVLDPLVAVLFSLP